MSHNWTTASPLLRLPCRTQNSTDWVPDWWPFQTSRPVCSSTAGSQVTGSESGSELLYDWRFTANQFILVANPLRLTTSSFICQLNTCCYNPLWREDGFVVHNWCWALPESRRTHGHILLSQIRDSPNLEGQVPVFISPRNRASRLYPQALGSLFVDSYDSQGYGGGTRTRLRMGK
jgi:hypothetical protein